jgi:23S rRNA (uridine2552-2'-O)-methyltransferase
VPGSWSQVASKKIKNGKILSVDIKEMLPISNTIFLKGDFTELETQNKIMKFFNTKIDTVVSDMASNTTGNKELDSLRTGNLCLNALEFSRKILKTNAYFVSKILWVQFLKRFRFGQRRYLKRY